MLDWASISTLEADMRKIVVIGGGTGTFVVLQGLRPYHFELSAIVSTADDGGSTGVLRDELGVLPPGDIRQALVALSPESSVLRDLFGYRFEDGSLKGHSFGNLLLSALEKVTGSFDRAVLEAGRVLAVDGQVIPVSRDPAYLRAEMADGSIIKGEHAIDEYIWSERSALQRIWLEPSCQLHPLAEAAIEEADLVALAPGSLFTSLIPNLVVEGMAEALRATKAPVVYISNLMTERGHTGAFFVQDFVDVLEEYAGKSFIDYVVYNTRMPAPELLERYKKEMERIPVRVDPKRRKHLSYKLVGVSLLNTRPAAVAAQDALAASRTLIRHDPTKVADVLYSLSMLRQVKKYFN